MGPDEGAQKTNRSESRRSKPGVPTGLPNLITRPLSWLYWIGIGYRNRRFDRGVGVTQLDRPVISIGNLSAGGTGKSPMVHWVARELITLGHHPVIAMRGYGAKVGEMGDEEREHRQALPDIPVIAQPDRIEGLRAFFATAIGAGVDCVILDDGFQHRQIARDLDIVLIDASAPANEDALLPRGFLRDPISSLSRADAVVITHCEMVEPDAVRGLRDWIRSVVSTRVKDRIWECDHVWTHLRLYTPTADGWDESCIELEDVRAWIERSQLTNKVVGVCGIGNPEGFFAMCDDAGLHLADRISLKDHDPFDQSTIARVNASVDASGSSMICMTRKDWVKIKDRGDAGIGVPVLVPTLGLRFTQGSSALSGVLQVCAQK